MNYDGLGSSYWQQQTERVERLRSRIVERTSTAPGRVVPTADDLAIGTGRRLHATVLFTDICGFSGRPAATADEQELLLRVLNLYFTEMIRIVEEYGGTVEKHTGDGLMAYFEDGAKGSAEENGTKRALASVLTMLAANDALISPVLRASDVAPIHFRASLEYGPITVARIGAAQRFSANVAIGNAANFACKMLGLVDEDDVGLGAAANTRIPPLWRDAWSKLSSKATGWVYSATGAPYPLYLYTGRWSRLV